MFATSKTPRSKPFSSGCDGVEHQTNGANGTVAATALARFRTGERSARARRFWRTPFALATSNINKNSICQERAPEHGLREPVVIMPMMAPLPSLLQAGCSLKR